MEPSTQFPQVILHAWPGRWNLASIEPGCLAAVLYLQLTIPGQFAIAECSNPDLSPSGRLPFLTHERRIVSTLPSIMKFVSALQPAVTSGRVREDLNVDVGPPLGAAEIVAWCAHVESNMGDLVSHMFYSLDTNWSKLTHPALASILPIPQRYYVPERLRESYRPRLEVAGLWNTPGAEETGKDPLKGATKKESYEKEKFSRIFEREKILEKARSSFDIYTRLLANSVFNHSRPTTLEILLAAHLLLLLNPPFPDPLIQTLLTESYPTLVSFARHIQEEGSESPVRILPSQGHTWKSLILWPRPERNLKPKIKTKEDIRYDRMRWGWIALAVSGVFVYLWATGVRIVLTVPTMDGEDLEALVETAGMDELEEDAVE